MPQQHFPFVEVRHVCHPTETLVRAGDVVIWTGVGLDEVSFPHGASPFTTDGPFHNGEPAVVRPGLRMGEVFVPEFTVNGQKQPTTGQIIHTGP